MGKKKTFFCLLAFLLVVWGNQAAFGTQPSNNDANATLRVVLHNQAIKMSPGPVVIDRQIYVPLRALCEAMGAEVRWDAAKAQAIISFQQQNYPVSGLIQENRLLVTLTDIEQVFNIKASYDPELSVILIGYENPPAKPQLMGLLPHYDGYTDEDVYWLSRIVEAEAKSESYESRLGVASVILNRLSDPSYPDTVKEVIFDKKHGVQFTPTANGTVYNDPSPLSMLAALDALEGRNNAVGALFFMNPKYATNFWMQKNRPYAFTIGGHAYYY